MRIVPALVLLLLAGCLAACGDSAVDVSKGGTVNAPDAAPAEARGAVAEADAFIAKQEIVAVGNRWKLKLPKPPKLTFDPKDTYTWVLKTNQGTMRFELLTDVAPMHASSTIYLTRLGFYDDTVFHRVIRDFMAQGGDPLGKGSGGPGYQYGGEFSPQVRHDRAGLLSMANRGPNTDGSQFFITFRATPHLDDKHTIFGQIVEGEDVVARLNDLGQPGQARSHAPKEPIVIEKATIEIE